MELRLPLEVSPGRETTCRAVFGTWGSFPDDAWAGHCPFVLASFTGWRSEMCPRIGFLPRGDREIGVLRNVEAPTRRRLECRRETGLNPRCDQKVGNPFQTKQGSQPSCRVQEGRLPCFVWKGFPTFRSHLRMRPVSRRHSRRGLVGGSTFRRTPISRSPLDKNPMPGHLSELPPVNAVNTKGQFFRASFGNKSQVPNTARQAASLPGDISRGKRSSMPQHKTRPDSPVPSLQGTLRSESEIRGTLRFLPQLEMRPSSNAPSPVESREAPPTSSFPGFSEPP